jgi:hypothetical protein
MSSKYVRIEFTDEVIGNKEINGTNIIPHDEICQGKYHLEWKLLDNSTVDKFLKITEQVKDERSIAWNRYLNRENESPAEQIQRLNEQIDLAIGHNEFSQEEITEDFKLLSTDTDEVSMKKLNMIHFAFEQKAITLTSSDSSIYKICEKLNQLVHSIEKHFVEKPMTSVFTVVRQASEFHGPDELDSPDRILADDDDYNRFGRCTENGDLFSDFFTVGKDLWAASLTDDKLLVQNKEVKQQLYISGSVNFMMCEDEFLNRGFDQKNSIDRYYKWCEDNNVRDYGYEYTLPKYNIGRATLGNLCAEKEDYADIVANLAKYPNVCNIGIIER